MVFSIAGCGDKAETDVSVQPDVAGIPSSEGSEEAGVPAEAVLL